MGHPGDRTWLNQDKHGKWEIRFRVPWYTTVHPHRRVQDELKGKRVKEIVDEVLMDHELLLKLSVRVFKDMDILDHIKEIYRLIHDRKVSPEQYTLIVLLRRTLTSLKEERPRWLVELTNYFNKIGAISKPLLPDSAKHNYTEDEVIHALSILASVWPVDPLQAT